MQEAPSGTGAHGSSDDSRILRYIKTLTSHQTNVKQQRMDRYLQQVKHQRAEDFALKPPRYPPICKAPRQEVKSAVSIAPLKKVAVGNEQRTVDGTSSSRGKNERRPRAKRQFEGKQNYQPRKKSKRGPPRKQKKPTVDSLDRFRFNGDKLQVGVAEELAGSEAPRLGTTPTPGNHTGNMIAERKTVLQGPTRPEDKPQARKSRFSSIGADSEHVTLNATHAVQIPKQLPSKVFKTYMEPVAAEAPRSSSFQSVSFLPPKDVQLEGLKDPLPAEVFIGDPLCSIMEAIYF